jgi:hypothetical protein
MGPRVVVGRPRAGAGMRLSRVDEQRLHDSVVALLAAEASIVLLDRSTGDAIDEELRYLMSDAVASREQVKLGQAPAADVVVQLRVEQHEVQRHTRQMRTIDREIVQYRGRTVVTFTAVHLITRQVLATGTVSAQRATPESLTDDVDPDQMRRSMLAEVSDTLGQRLRAVLAATGR